MNGTRKIAVALAAVFVLALGALFVREPIAEFLVGPLYRGYLVLQLAYRSIPQGLQWALLLALVVLIGVRSLYHRRDPPREPADLPPDEDSRLQIWARWIALSLEGEYFQLHMARKLGDLVVDIIAHQESEPIDIVRDRVSAGTLDVPTHVLKFLDIRLSRINFRRFQHILNRLHLGPMPSLGDVGYLPIVEYLETLLEITDEH